MDKLPNVRILRSLGAGRAWIVRQGLREALPLAFAGAIAGVAAGTGVALLAGSLDLLVVFGHSVRPELSIPGLVAIALVPVALSLASTVLFLASHSGARPGELGREGPGPQPALEEVLA